MNPDEHWHRAGELLDQAEEQAQGSPKASGVRAGCALVHAVMAGIGFKTGRAVLWAKPDIQDTPKQGIQDT